MREAKKTGRMPFLSKDWRSPGEKWVRYCGGWEMKKAVWATHRGGKRENDCCREDSSEDSGCELCDEMVVNNNNSAKVEVGSWDSSVFEFEQDHADQFQESTESVEARVRAWNSKKRFSLVSFHLKRITGKNSRGTEQSESAPPRPACPVVASAQQEEQELFQPHCQITVKSTKEVAGFNALADAFLRLDFIHALRDVRRFNFVSKIMSVLFSHEKLMTLPGAAQKTLFRMLEEMSEVVYANDRHEHVLRKLLDEVNATMSIYHVWGSHLGSAHLFRQHLESRRRITEIVEKTQVKYKQDLASTPSRSGNRGRGGCKNRHASSSSTASTASSSCSSPGLVNSLPEECVREILLRLSDPKDVERAGDACVTMNTIAREKRVWRELAQTHFTRNQIDFLQKERPELRNTTDWKHLYTTLRRRFGIPEEGFAETLFLCRKCRSLYWRSLGHPCLALKTDSDEDSNAPTPEEWERLQQPIKPSTFLSYFSV